MAFPLITIDKPSNLTFVFPFLTAFLLIILPHHGTIGVVQHDMNTTSIGAIIDINSRIGKEVKTAIEIAVQTFNTNSSCHKLFVYFQNPSRNPLQTAYAAEELIRKKEVKTIIGMETWQEATIVADVGNQAEVPIISFSGTAITPSLMPLQWPFLVRMTNNVAEEIRCIAAIVRSFHWRKVIAIYEADTYGGDLGMLALLSGALQDVGSEIEYRSVLPPFSSLSDPEGIVREAVSKLLTKQSRVFIVLHSSLSLATYLFREAKHMRIMGKNSAWVITETLSGLLDSVNNSVILSMQGAIGMKTYFSEESRSFLHFKRQFRQTFQSDYPDEDNSEPGIYALRAYDSITIITKAMKRSSTCTNTNTTSTMLLKNILSSNFTGLGGRISFQFGELSPSVFRIINVIGKRYKEIGFWSSKIGFSDGHINGNDNMEMLDRLVNWPGDLNRVPKGWAMPTDAEPMKIGVPGRASFKDFVRVEWMSENLYKCSGFCIDVFEEVKKKLGYPLPCQFVPYNGTYDDLVNHVANKTFDAIIGDVTILSERAKHVEFTPPFTESNLVMIDPVKHKNSDRWILFFGPFTPGLWLATFLISVYTMIVVWCLECQSDQRFRRPEGVWLTFRSLFIERDFQNNCARVVGVIWIFVMLTLSSSYPANLTSFLTVPRLQLTVKDIRWVRNKNLTVGCNTNSFVRKYLETRFKFNPENIKNISDGSNYMKELKSGTIKVAFLELPYAKAFLNKNCKGYVGISLKDRFGGMGFVFPKGSPIRNDFSEAILKLSEDGTLVRLEAKWFAPSSTCQTSQTLSYRSTAHTGQLGLETFDVIFIISGTISTVCWVAYFFCKRYNQ